MARFSSCLQSEFQNLQDKNISSGSQLKTVESPMLYMSRKKGEEVLKTLQRMQTSVLKKLKKSRKKTKKDRKAAQLSQTHPADGVPGTDVIKVYRGDKELIPETTLASASNEGFWVDGMSCSLLGIRFQVRVNPPTVIERKVNLFSHGRAPVYADIPLAVTYETMFADGVLFEWIATDKGGCSTVRSETALFIPTGNDIGSTVSVSVTPFRFHCEGGGAEAAETLSGKPIVIGDKSEVSTYSNAVEELPTLGIEEIRKGWLRERELKLSTERNLRVLSYNILADTYANQEQAQIYLFQHCTKDVLSAGRRMQLILAEILLYRPDIICLQEVDEKIFDSLFFPVLSASGYGGYYSGKRVLLESNNDESERLKQEGVVERTDNDSPVKDESERLGQEGCAMFWSRSKFAEPHEHQKLVFPLRDLIDLNESKGDGNANLNGLEWKVDAVIDLLENHPSLKQAIMERVGTIAQIAILPYDPKHDGVNANKQRRVVVVCNTHLFFHPLADHVRAIQALFLVRKIHAVCRDPKSWVCIEDIIKGNEKTTVTKAASTCNGSLDGAKSEQQLPLILCGDFNSDPFSGAVQLLFTRTLFPDHDTCWENLFKFYWEKEEVNENTGERKDAEQIKEKVVVPTLHIPNEFHPIFCATDPIPQFTNFSLGFSDTLDYVFASEPTPLSKWGFQPESSAPMPSRSDMTKLVAMPNEQFPSDHVSILVDLYWKHFDQ